MKRFERLRDFLAVVGVLVGVGSSFSFGGINPKSWRFSRELGGGWCDAERSCCRNFGRLLLSLPSNEIIPCWDGVEPFANGLWDDPSKLDKSLLVLFTGRWWLEDDKLCCLKRRWIVSSHFFANLDFKSLLTYEVMLSFLNNCDDDLAISCWLWVHSLDLSSLTIHLLDSECYVAVHDN